MTERDPRIGHFIKGAIPQEPLPPPVPDFDIHSIESEAQKIAVYEYVIEDLTLTWESKLHRFNDLINSTALVRSQINSPKGEWAYSDIWKSDDDKFSLTYRLDHEKSKILKRKKSIKSELKSFGWRNSEQRVEVTAFLDKNKINRVGLSLKDLKVIQEIVNNIGPLSGLYPFINKVDIEEDLIDLEEMDETDLLGMAGLLKKIDLDILILDINCGVANPNLFLVTDTPNGVIHSGRWTLSPETSGLFKSPDVERTFTGEDITQAAVDILNLIPTE